MKVGWGKAVVGLLLLSLLTVLFVSAGCDRGDDDDDGVDMDKKGLYRCKDCNDVLSWLREMEIQRMVRALEMERDYWQNGGYYDDDDGWFDDDGDDVVSDDDDAAPGDDDDAAADDDAADDDNYEGDDDEATGDDDDNEHSDTNVQEEGVDEADMIKTDGNYLFIANGGWLLIFDADPQEDTHQVGALDIEGNVADMYLYGDTALVFSLVPSYSVPETVWPEIPRDELYWDVVKVSVVDHSDKSDPTLLRELYVEGNLLNSRRIGATTRIVTNCFKNGPEYETWIDGWSYETPEEIDAAIDALIEQNTEIIDSAGLEAWLPRYYDIVHTAGGTEITAGFVSECPDHYRPYEPLGTSILSVITVLLDDPTARQTDVSIIAEGYIMYASSQSLYITGSFDNSWEWAGDDFTDMSELHKFDIATDPTEALYVASGAVEGWVLNQFSMSEYEGYLRVASSYGGWWNNTPQRNGVFVFQQQGDNLAQVGSYEDFATDEQIYAARFLGARGFVVTFEQTDPLFTFDMSNPTNPVLVGELEVPGFSTYLHPMGDDHLLAIGEGGDWWGSNGGVALSMFDVSDFAHPSMIHHLDLGDWDTGSEAKYNHHAFLYYEPKNLLVIPLTYWGWYGDDDDDWTDDDAIDDDLIDDDVAPDDDDWKDDDDTPVTDDDTIDDDVSDDDTGGEDSFSGFYVFYTSPTIGFDQQATIEHTDFVGAEGSDYYYSMSEPRRSAVINNHLFTISDLGLVVTEIGSWVNDVEENLPWQDWDYGWEDDDYYDDDDDFVDDDDDSSEPGVDPEA